MEISMRKKVAAATATATIAAMILAGCGNSSGSGERLASDGKPEVEALVVKNANTAQMKTMQWPKDLEKMCDCHIKWKEVDSQAWQQQQSATLAGGNIADLSFRAYYTGTLDKYGSQFVDFNKHLDEMPHVKAMFDKYPTVYKHAQSENGAIYTLPTYKGDSYNSTGQHMFINKKWLDKLGLQMPQTWDELEQVLKAFVTQDPNGNGKNDEIGMDFPKLKTDAFTWYTPYMLLNSTGIVTLFNSSPAQQGIYAKDGKVKSFLVTDEYKRVTKYLARLMKEGLVPRDVLSKDDSTYGNEVQGDGTTARVGFIFSWAARTSLGPKLADQYVAVPPLKETADQPDSSLVWDASGEVAPFVGNSLAMSSSAPNQKTLFKVIDAMYTQDMSVYSWWSKKYVKKIDKNTYKIDPKKFTLTMSPTQLMASYIPPNVKLEGDIDAAQQQEADKVYKPYYKHYDHTKDVVPTYVKTPLSVADRLQNLNTTIMNYAMSTTANWIQGNSDIDKEWDSYVAKLNNAGLKDQVKIWQDAYDKWVK